MIGLDPRIYTYRAHVMWRKIGICYGLGLVCCGHDLVCCLCKNHRSFDMSIISGFSKISEGNNLSALGVQCRVDFFSLV